MVQFYFLSVFMNLLGGLSLMLSPITSQRPAIAGLRVFLRDPTVSLVTGILAAVVGAFKLLTVIRGDIPVVGDFLPAVAGITVGSTLILEHFRGGQGSRFEVFLLEHKAAIGLSAIIAGGVHFLFPMVLFL